MSYSCHKPRYFVAHYLLETMEEVEFNSEKSYNFPQLLMYTFDYQALIFLLKKHNYTYRYSRLITIFLLGSRTTLLLSPIV